MLKYGLRGAQRHAVHLHHLCTLNLLDFPQHLRDAESLPRARGAGDVEGAGGLFLQVGNEIFPEGSELLVPADYGVGSADCQGLQSTCGREISEWGLFVIS